MLIPKSYVDDAIGRTDIVALIDARVRLKKTGKNYSACCPFHDEKTPSFTVSPDKQFYYCFGCGASGNALGFVMDYDRLDFRDAALTLGRNAGLQDPDDTETSAQASAAIRWQEYRQLKTRLCDANLYFGLSGEAHYQQESEKLRAIIAKKYSDLVKLEKRHHMVLMMRDEQMELIAYKLKHNDEAGNDCALRLPPRIVTEQKRALLAQQRITKLQELING